VQAPSSPEAVEEEIEIEKEESVKEEEVVIAIPEQRTRVLLAD
jgi:hypothetical protein